MVLESQPRTLETYSMPPCPSLAASMAAYRLRSFSESESWNIRIECSISGLYVMGGRPLRGLDGPCHGYTVRPEDREVIELAVLSRSIWIRIRLRATPTSSQSRTISRVRSSVNRGLEIRTSSTLC